MRIKNITKKDVSIVSLWYCWEMLDNSCCDAWGCVFYVCVCFMCVCVLCVCVLCVCVFCVCVLCVCVFYVCVCFVCVCVCEFVYITVYYKLHFENFGKINCLTFETIVLCRISCICFIWQGSVDAGSKRPITLTWSPQPGQNVWIKHFCFNYSY